MKKSFKGILALVSAIVVIPVVGIITSAALVTEESQQESVTASVQVAKSTIDNIEWVPEYSTATISAIITPSGISGAREQEIAKEMQRQIDAAQKAVKARKKKEKKQKEAVKTAGKKLRLAKVKIKRMQKKAKVQVDGITYSVGSGGDSATKSFLYHLRSNGSSTFCSTSAQYRLQQNAYTGKCGIRMVGERYCIAVGSGFCSKIGTKLDVTLENGKVLKCVMADMKSDRHTDSTHRYHVSDGSYVEFVVDRNVIHPMARKMGNFNYAPGFKGKVIKITVYK